MFSIARFEINKKINKIARFLYVLIIVYPNIKKGTIKFLFFNLRFIVRFS